MQPSLELLDKKLLLQNIHPSIATQIYEWFIFTNIASTNDYLLTNAAHFSGLNVVCLAEKQTAGRGRLGREWVSPFAQNIYLSLLSHFSFNASNITGLNIVTAVSVAEAIQIVTGLSTIQLKWPNDIYFNDAKLGGILIDIIHKAAGELAVVIGVGLNIHMSVSAETKIAKPWTTLTNAAQKNISRNKMSGALIQQLLLNLAAFQSDGLTQFIKKWQALDYLVGKNIIVESATQTLEGVAQGINQLGQLTLKTKDGTIKTITTGDASLKWS